AFSICNHVSRQTGKPNMVFTLGHSHLKIRNMAPRTIDTYTYQLSRFEEFLQAKGKQAAEATPEDVREYQPMLIEVRALSFYKNKIDFAAFRNRSQIPPSSLSLQKLGFLSFRLVIAAHRVVFAQINCENQNCYIDGRVVSLWPGTARPLA
ncbi:MAG: phage integrase N-terminal SAM-like domain-containing protein, partial [Planctomycetota bacterium]